MLLNCVVYTEYHTPGKFEPVYFCRERLAVAVGVGGSHVPSFLASFVWKHGCLCARV